MCYILYIPLSTLTECDRLTITFMKLRNNKIIGAMDHSLTPTADMLLQTESDTEVATEIIIGVDGIAENQAPPMPAAPQTPGVTTMTSPPPVDSTNAPTVTDNTFAVMMQQMLAQFSQLNDKLNKQDENLSNQLTILHAQMQHQSETVNQTLATQTACIDDIRKQLAQQKHDITQHRSDVTALVHEQVSGLAAEVINTQETVRRDIVALNVEITATKSNLQRLDQQVENINEQVTTDRERFLAQVQEVTKATCDNVETRQAIVNTEMQEKITEIQANLAKVTENNNNNITQALSQLSQVVSAHQIRNNNSQEYVPNDNNMLEMHNTVPPFHSLRPTAGSMTETAGGLTPSEHRTVGPSEVTPTSPVVPRTTGRDTAHCSDQNNAHHTLPFLSELPLPMFDANKENAKQFIIDLEGYFDLKRIPAYYRMVLVARALTGSALNWFRIAITSQTTYEVFRTAFLNKFWGPNAQSETRNKINNGKYHPGAGVGLVDYFLKYALLARKLDPPLSDTEFIQLMTAHMPDDIRNHLIVARPPTIHEAVSLLTDLQRTTAPQANNRFTTNERGRDRPPNRPCRYLGEERARPPFHTSQQWVNNTTTRERYQTDLPRDRFTGRGEQWPRGRQSQDVRIQMLDVDNTSRRRTRNTRTGHDRPRGSWHDTRGQWHSNNGQQGRHSPVPNHNGRQSPQPQSAAPSVASATYQNTSNQSPPPNHVNNTATQPITTMANHTTQWGN